MKKMVVLLTLLISLQTAFAGKQRNLELVIISTEFPAQDNFMNSTLCLVEGRDLNSQELVLVVEDVTDCFYTRLAQQERVITIPGNELGTINFQPMLQDLEKRFPEHIIRRSSGE